MERHPDFQIESFRSRVNSRATVIITHTPSGLVSRAEQWLSDHAHIDAWKGMANLLAEWLRSHAAPTADSPS